LHILNKMRMGNSNASDSDDYVKKDG